MNTKAIIEELNKRIAQLDVEVKNINEQLDIDIKKMKEKLAPLENSLSEARTSRNIYLQACQRLQHDMAKRMGRTFIQQEEQTTQVKAPDLTKTLLIPKIR